MRHSPQVRHAFVFLLYALVVWLLLLLFAACLAPQETSWLPAALWKYFPRPTPYAARVVGAATVALLRAIRAACRLGRRNCEGSGVSCREDSALCAERPPGCHSANNAIGSVACTEDRDGSQTGIVQAHPPKQPRQRRLLRPFSRWRKTLSCARRS